MKKIVAALTTAMFAIALVVVGAAAPASAHTPTLQGSATCNATTGTWTVNYSFAATNVPNGVEASTKVTGYTPAGSTLTSGNGVGTGTNLVLSTYSSAPMNGVATRTGNWTATLTQTGIAASATSASVTIHTDWSDKATGNASRTVSFTGTCGTPTPPVTPKDASASVSTTAATCSSGETLVLGKTVNSSWQGQPSYSGANYTAVAKADSGHKFADAANVTSDNSIETFTGTLADKLSPTNPKCVVVPPTPVCIPASAVHYTYDNKSNSGVVTVDPVPNSTGKLCEGFFVTATSWKYTTTNSVWPQTRDVMNTYYIDTVGDHPYSATVTCGQGDIYAASAAAGQPSPPLQLNGPSNPWPEHFLHDMGFKGISPTYTQSSLDCFKPVDVTGSPTQTVATCAAPTANSISLPAVKGGIWTVTSGANTTSLPIGTGKDSGPVWGYGTYTITLTDGNPTDGYHVTAPATLWTWTPVDISKVDCNTVVTPVDPKFNPVTTCGTTGSIVLPADTDAIAYTRTAGDGHSGVNTVTATALGKNEFPPATVGGPPLTTMSWTFDLGQPVDCIPLAPAVTKVVDQTCTAGVANGGTITVQDTTGLVYTLSGGPANLDHQVISGTTSNLAPGDYTVDVTIDNSTNPNFVFAPGATKSFPITIAPALDCRSIVVSATPTPAECTPTPNGVTPQTYTPGMVTVVGDADVTFTISDGTTTSPLATGTTKLNAGTYTVAAQLTAAATAAGAALPVSNWGFTIAPVDCTVQAGAVTPPTASTCTVLDAGTNLPSWVHLTATPNVSYEIFPTGNPAAATPLTDGYTSEPLGTYTVIATANNGYELDSSGTLTQQWNITVDDLRFCIPTDASWHAGATADPATCASPTTQLGAINLLHLASETGKVTYTITNNKTGVVINAGATKGQVLVAPGSYTVHAKAVPKGDGISTASVFRVTVAAATGVCATITTLAFTGQSASFGILGFLLAGGMLALGFAALFIRRANRRNAA